MFRFEYEKSYVWLFLVFGAAFFAGCSIFGTKWGILAMPAVIAVVLSCEIRSGIAINSWWRAVHRKGSWQYVASLAFHLFGFLIFSWVAYTEFVDPGLP